MLRRVLIANRGEIAVRVARACREMGIESVAVYSDADADSVHVRVADRAVRIGPAPAVESYLSIPALIEAARQTDADAVHPGYGFLAEHAGFARACEENGLVFVGPLAAVIERMGSKIAARELMQTAGVPVVPGATPHDQSDHGVIEAARTLGYPVLVKASAGGGGKGMRILEREDGAAALVGAARREALAAFGDGTLYVERLIERPRHIEIQVVADTHGNVVHLFERECSIQRRYQKIIEESPSPALTSSIRNKMTSAAVAAARAAEYRNAGTIEFLFEGEGDSASFYFLEMNTRLQVEHPITEAVTGVDLVQAQLAIAAGERLPWTQESLTSRGHAVECRIYAEDPEQNFLPQAGPLLVYREPSGPGIRVDSGVTEGSVVTVNYDPLLAKLIVSAESRAKAIARASTALRQYPILGIRSNVSFLIGLLELPEFAAGKLDTGLVARHLESLTRSDDPDPRAVAAAALAAASQSAPETSSLRIVANDPWTVPSGWGR